MMKMNNKILKQYLAKEFIINELDKLKYFMGIEIVQYKYEHFYFSTEIHL